MVQMHKHVGDAKLREMDAGTHTFTRTRAPAYTYTHTLKRHTGLHPPTHPRAHACIHAYPHAHAHSFSHTHSHSPPPPTETLRQVGPDGEDILCHVCLACPSEGRGVSLTRQRGVIEGGEGRLVRGWEGDAQGGAHTYASKAEARAFVC